MTTNRAGGAFRRLRQGLLARDGAGLPDADLLRLYYRDQDEAAFAALVRRHGSMVWGVCRRLLRHHHDAEDAFQATFLVLARKAASVTPPGRVAAWLYGVAYHIARKASYRAARQRGRERPAWGTPEPSAPEALEGSDLRAVLDRELNRLPEKLRLVLLLCDLEGRTYREAARALDCPEGTVAGRLSRARAALAARLARAGAGLGGAALAAALAAEAAWAGMPETVASSAIKVAALAAAGEAAAGAAVPRFLRFMKGGLQAMWRGQVKIVVAAALAVGAVGGGLYFAAQGGEEAPKAAPVAPAPPAVADPADEEQQAEKDRQELEKQAEALVKEYERLLRKSEAARVAVGEIKKTMARLKEKTDDATVLEALGEVEKGLAEMRKELQDKKEKGPAKPED